MDAAALVVLGTAAALKAAAPGPCILVAASRAMTSGFGCGLRVAGGAVVANALLLGVAVALLAASLAVAAPAEAALRVAGPGLLVAVGLTMLCARPAAPASAPVQGRWRPGDVTLGLALGVASPLNLVFMLTVVPQVVEAGSLDAACVAAMAAVVLLGGALPLIGACAFASSLVKPGLWQMRIVTRLCGAALLGFAGLAAAGLP